MDVLLLIVMTNEYSAAQMALRRATDAEKRCAQFEEQVLQLRAKIPAGAGAGAE